MPSGRQSDRPDAGSKVVTFNAEPGKVRWEKQVADNAERYYFNHVLMIVKRKVVMGTNDGSGEGRPGRLSAPTVTARGPGD